MKYTVKYWYEDLSHITGIKAGKSITDKTLLKLIHSKKVNVAIFALWEEPTCWITSTDFKQR